MNYLNKLLTIEDVARMQEISTWTVRTWISKGLKHMKGRPIRIKAEWVDDFIEEQAKVVERPCYKSNIKIKPLKRVHISSDEKFKIEDFLINKGAKK